MYNITKYILYLMLQCICKKSIYFGWGIKLLGAWRPSEKCLKLSARVYDSMNNMKHYKIIIWCKLMIQFRIVTECIHDLILQGMMTIKCIINIMMQHMMITRCTLNLVMQYMIITKCTLGLMLQCMIIMKWNLNMMMRYIMTLWCILKLMMQ